tara:strand:+ start:1009 stop:1599 length:591 start_codon:yes stop_codon:yes gene_type:complete
MYYPNLIPSLIEALDNGIGEGKAFSMDDLKDARELAIFGQVVWEACRYLWTCHLSHESNDGGEVLAEPKLRLDFIMRQCTYAEKGAVMQKSMDLEFLAECDEPTAALQPTAHRLWTTTEEVMDWGDDPWDDYDHQGQADAVAGRLTDDEPEVQAVMPEVTEEARLAGMAGGCAAHNEAMEQSLESYEDGPIDGYDY